MAMSHAPLTHNPASSAAKTDTNASKCQFVPIKPAFRPLLPKPSTRDPSPSNGIHIHTRATLNTGRKRLSTSKADAQKRRKSYSLNASSPKSIRTDSRMDSLDASTNSLTMLKTPTTLHSGNSDTHQSNATPTDLRYSIPAAGSDQLYQPSGFAKGSKDIYSAERATPSLSTTSLDDQATPSTPMSIDESPISMNAASIFGSTRDGSTPNGTVDPLNIVSENDEFGLDGGDVVSSFGQLDQIDNTTLTPPDSQKSFSVSAFATYDSANDFDGFSDFYFRTASSGTDSVGENVNNTGGAQDPISVSLGNSVAGELDIGDREDDFSILEYLAPSTDLF